MPAKVITIDDMLAESKSSRDKVSGKPEKWYYWTEPSAQTMMVRCPHCKHITATRENFYRTVCELCGVPIGPNIMMVGRKAAPSFHSCYSHNDLDKLSMETETVCVGVTPDFKRLYTYTCRERYVFNKETKRAYRLTGKAGKPLTIRTYKGFLESTDNWEAVNLLIAYNEAHPMWRITEVSHQRTHVMGDDVLNIVTACWRYPQVSLLARYPVFAEVCRWICYNGTKITATNPRGIFNEVFNANLGKAQFKKLIDVCTHSDRVVFYAKLFHTLYHCGYGPLAVDIIKADPYIPFHEILDIAGYIAANSPAPHIALRRLFSVLHSPSMTYIFCDTLRLSRTYGIPLPNIAAYSGKELGRLHDYLIKTTRDMVPRALAEDNERYINNVYPKLSHYNYVGEKYQIVVPETLDDICMEGYKMGHCVASYTHEASFGYIAILFLRTLDNQRVATIKLERSNVFQVKARENRYPGDEAIAFVKEFCKEKKLKYIRW